MEKHLEATGENKSIYYPPLYSTPSSTAGSRAGCHAKVSGEEAYLCTRQVCCQSIARGIILVNIINVYDYFNAELWDMFPADFYPYIVS